MKRWSRTGDYFQVEKTEAKTIRVGAVCAAKVGRKEWVRRFSSECRWS